MNQGAKIVLLVEDNYAHANLFMRCFSEHDIPHKIYHVSDGEEALNYLYRRGSYVDPNESPKPCVIFLDLRMPKVNGLSVLIEIKADEKLRNIPIVVFTTSDEEKDLSTAYHHYVNSFLIKPMDFDEFSKLVSIMAAYWLKWNRLPEPI